MSRVGREKQSTENLECAAGSTQQLETGRSGAKRRAAWGCAGSQQMATEKGSRLPSLLQGSAVREVEAQGTGSRSSSPDGRGGPAGGAGTNRRCGGGAASGAAAACAAHAVLSAAAAIPF